MLLGLDWKRLLLVLGIVGSVWFVLADATRANAADEDFDFYYYSDYAEVAEYDGTDTEIVIPETSRGLPVTAIGDHAFRRKNLTKVTFPEGLKTIGVSAFHGNQLTEVEIPASVTSIGIFAFNDNDLTKVTLYEGLQTIDGAAFGHNAISEIEIPASVSWIGMNAFNSSGLTKLKLNEGLLEEVGYAAFTNNELTEVEIPATVKLISYAAFKNNKLSKVTLNEGLETIWYSAFDDNDLTTIEIPSTVNVIYGDAFYNNDLAYAVIPPSVDLIENNAFGSNRPDFTIIGSTGSPAHNYTINYNIPFIDAATILLPDIRFAPNGQDWAQAAATTVTGDTYGVFNLKYAWSNTATAPAPGAEWISIQSGEEIEQSSEGEWFLHVHGSLLDRADTWHSKRFLVDKTPPALSITMTTGPSSVPYVHDTWSTGPVTVNAATYDPLGEVREIVVETEYDSRSSVAAYPGNAYSVPLAGNGIYQLKITAIDQAGNASATEQRIVKINNSSSPPTSAPDEESGNANLKELLVSAGMLTPIFSGDVTQYTLRIDPKVQSLTVTLLPEHAQASTSVGGQALGSGRMNADISLEPDVNQFEIVVTAEDGTKRTYRVVLERDDADKDPVEAACSKTAAFTDIAGHWGEMYIIEASCQAIVQGYPDGSFGPDRVVTRAEFTVMLAGLFTWEGDAAALTFSDLTVKEHWAKQAIAQAAAAGVVSGYPDGSFRPEGTITRAEMAVMIANALGLPTDAYHSTAFDDDAKIPAWAKNAAESIRQLGIVNGRGGNNFVPDEAATRAEAALMLLRAVEMK